MSIDITTIGVGVDTSKLKSGTRELDSFGKSADAASRKADGLTNSSQKLSKESGAASLSLGRMAGALAAVASVASLGRTLDEYTKFTAQLKLATRSQSEYNTALSDVNRIAKTAQASLASIGTLYARLNNALRETGASQAQVGKITETVGLALKVSGATANEAASAMLQLSQAFGSGVLRGEEFNAVNEAAPALMRALAESIGVPIGALRELATNGQLTSDVLSKAFGDETLLNKFREQAKEINTISGAWQGFKNKFITYIGEMDKAVGASKYLAKLLNFSGELLFPQARTLNAKDQEAADKKELEFLSKKGALGLRENARLEKLAALRQRMGVTGNQLGGSRAITDTGSYAPNFTANVEAENIDEIHRQQEEALRIRNDAARKHADERRKINDEALQDIQDEINFEQEIKQAGNDADIKRLKDLAELEKKEYERKLKQVELLQDQANKNFKEAQDAYLDAEREKLKEFEKTVDGIDQVFREGFANMVNGGKSSWKSFTKSLMTTFKTTVADQIYKMLAQPFVVKLVGSVLGIGASGGASAAGGLINNIASVGGTGAAGGGIGGLGDLFSMGKSLFGNGGFQGALVGSIENLGTIFSNGMGGLSDSIGGFLGANAGMIADVLPFAGAALQLLQGNTKGAAFTAIGAAVGSFIPVIGTALGGLIGSFVGSLFGGKDYKRFGTTVSGVKVGQEEYAKTGEGKIYDRKIAGIADPLNNLNEAFSNTLSTLFKSFDIESTIGTTSGMFQRGKSKKSGGIFGASVDGVGIGDMKVQIKKGTLEQVYNALVDMVMGEGLVRAIQASKLSSSIKSLFDGFTDKTQVTALIQATMNLNGAQAELASRFGITVDQSAQAAKSTGLVGQALIDYVNKLTASAMAFATVGDQLIKFRTSLENVYGGGLPDTLKAYDAALKGIDKTTQEGIDTFVELFGIRDQFVQFRQAIDGLKGNVRGALFGMVSDAEKQQMLNEDLAKLFGDLGRDVPGSIQELIALGKSIDYTTAEGLNLASVFPSLVQAFNQTQSAVESLLNTMRDSSKFATSFEFNRYTGVAGNYGTSFANNYVDNMASFDVGTSFVPKDGVAMIHKGEAVLTAGQNSSITQDSANMVAELRALRVDNQNMRRELQSIAISSMKTEKSLDRLQKDGFIIRDVDANGDPQILQVEVV
jgi:tape measure domain-containing protein